ncbi:MAG: carboxypeptidase-like regulatory domain-containing protein [Flavobacteriaceae bacterium]|nr:carboxypeptidase-like regulatory domain-containing protein [Flavobacteriaceae bacterium]
MKNIYFLLLILISFNIKAQSKKVKIIDSISFEPVPFATIFFSNNNGIISDEDGLFELIPEQYSKKDSLFISSMGFEPKQFSLDIFNDSIIRLVPKTISLKNVVVTNNQLSSNEIIDSVKLYIDKNYNFNITQNKLFFRQEFNQELEKFKLNKFKSTIKDLNAESMDSMTNNLPKKSKNELESLSYYYVNSNIDVPKIKLIKSRRTNDDNESDLSKSLGDKLEKSLRENLKSNSYFKIRSGWLPFSGDLTFNGLWEIDSTNQDQLNKLKEEEVKRKENFSIGQKGRIQSVYLKSFFNPNSELNFILKSKNYIFSNSELTYLGNELVYVIECYPKRGDKYKGTIYVNSDDYAVVRIDYENIKPLSNFKLLGVSFSSNLEKGRMVFSKFENEKYSLSYYQNSRGNKISIKRPFKIIEKNKFVKGRKKQNQISAKLDFTSSSIYNTELQVFKVRSLDKVQFEEIDEKNQILPIYLKEFKKDFWEDFK